MKKFSPKLVGFLQAALLTLYVMVFATVGQNFQAWAAMHRATVTPVVATILLLLAFVISALICGSIIFGYSIYLFFGDKKGDAMRTVSWSLIWLLVFLALFLLAVR